MIDTTLKLPTPSQFLGLQSDPAIFINQMPLLEMVYLQARTDCGGIGKMAALDDVFYDKHNETVNSPTTGWIVSLDHLLAINATKNDPVIEGMYAFDFEFSNRPCGCSIYASPSFSNMDSYFALLSDFFKTPESRSHLDNWREAMAPLDHHCPECEKAGKNRAAYPEEHPLYAIAQLLITEQTPVFARMLSDHSDFTASFTPENILIDRGVISLIDNRSTVLSLNMKNIHASVVKNKVVDGEIVASLTCHNSLGRAGIEFIVEDPDLTSEWIRAFQPGDA